MISLPSLAAFAILSALAAEPAADHPAADRWPSFRGPGASGISPARSAPARWSVEKGENILWKTPIPGLGHSSPVVWGDRIFVTTAIRAGGEGNLRVGLYGDVRSVEDKAEHSWEVLCIDRASGRVLWQKALRKGVPKVKRHPKSTHANPTPAVDGKRVVAFFGSEGLHCLDLDGKPLWVVDLGLLDSAFHAVHDAQWGFGSSPVIHDGRVIVQCDVLSGCFLAAFDAATGREVWRTPRDDVPTWSTPAIDLRDGRTRILANGHRHIAGYDFATGKEVWRLRGGGDIPVPAPIVAGGLAFFTSAHGGTAPILAVRASAAGDITHPEGKTSNDHLAWSRARGGNYMQTPIAIDDILYLCGDSGVLSAYRLATGDEIAKRRLATGAFTASPVSAAGRIYFTSEEGAVHVVKAGAALEEIAANDLGETCLATPAVAEGAIYFRTRSHIIAVGER
jgi:outer membrane protein assembly factor BamB